MPAGKSRGGRAEPSPQFFAFVAQIVGLARNVAPGVADMLDPEGRTAATSWSGTRERGLKLCASMLTYARVELADDAEAGRLDRALAAVRAEFDAASAEGDVQP